MYLKKFVLLLIFAPISQAATQGVAADEYNHHQRNLLNGIEKYLKNELQLYPDLYTQADIDGLIMTIKPGICMGLSMFWLYAQRISEKENPDSKEQDDLVFFNRVYKDLVFFKETSPLTAPQRADIERFLSHILVFHPHTKDNKPLITPSDVTTTQDPTTFLELTTGERPQKNYSLKALISKNIFLNWLKELAKPGQMILMAYSYKADNGLSGHATALYPCKDGSFYYYNSKATEGAKQYDSLKEVVDVFWKNSDTFTKNKKFTKETAVFKYITLKSFRFAADAPYTGPDPDDLVFTMPDIIDILKNLDLSDDRTEFDLFFDDLEGLSLEEFSEVFAAPELSQKTKEYFFHLPLVPQEQFPEVLQKK